MTGTPAYVRREGSHLVPADEASEEIVRKLPAGRTVEVTIIRRRSAEQLRWYWAMCGKVADSLQALGKEEASAEWVDVRLRIGTGHCELVPLSAVMQMETGVAYAATPSRIAFDKLSQDEFTRFVDRCLAFIATKLLPHMPTRELRAQVEAAMVPRRTAA